MIPSPDALYADPLRAIIPGAGIVVVRSDFTVLIGDTDHRRANEVWQAIGTDHTVDAIIDVLARQGVSSMPDVVIAASEGHQLRIIVRGNVAAEVTTECRSARPDAAASSAPIADSGASNQQGVAQHYRLAGTGIRSWSETTVADWSSCRMFLVDGDGANVAAARSQAIALVSSGIAAAGVVLWDCALVTSDTTTADVAATALATGAESAPAPVTAQPSAMSEIAVEPNLSESTGTPTQHRDQVDLADSGDEIDDDPYADLFGRTLHRDVQQAAVSESSVTDVVTATDAAPPIEVDDALVASDDSSAQSNDTRSLADLRDGGSWDGAPNEPTPPEIPATHRTSLGDHDGHTVSLTELRRQRDAGQSAAAPLTATSTPNNPTVTGPTVQAVLCPVGHPNPAYSSQCRQCGEPVGGATVVVARPSLGRLRASTGEVIELDRPVIVGRNPSLTGRRLSEIPHQWQISVGDGLSRNHAMFHIDGWQVRVEDLGSVNSTTVTLPGREPEMLRAGEPVLITDGTLVDLGGEVTCSYDSTA